LADKSVKYPLGQVKDLPLQVRKFYIFIDFIMIEMDEDPDTPLIFGRPFLNTVGTQMDIRGGKLTFDIRKEKVEFVMFKALKYPANDGNFYRVDMIDVIVKEKIEELSINDPVDRLIIYPTNKEFERFHKQLEFEILKFERKEQDHGSQSQNHEL
jgi:hypothetical protein